MVLSLIGCLKSKPPSFSDQKNHRVERTTNCPQIYEWTLTGRRIKLYYLKPLRLGVLCIMCNNAQDLGRLSHWRNNRLRNMDR